MSVEIIGMVGTRDASEIKGPLVDGPVVDWMDGPVVDPGCLVDISKAHDDAGFDRVLSDDRQHLGESYLPVFIEDVRKLLA